MQWFLPFSGLIYSIATRIWFRTLKISHNHLSFKPQCTPEISPIVILFFCTVVCSCYPKLYGLLELICLYDPGLIAMPKPLLVDIPYPSLFVVVRLGNQVVNLTKSLFWNLGSCRCWYATFDLNSLKLPWELCNINHYTVPGNFPTAYPTI